MSISLQPEVKDNYYGSINEVIQLYFDFVKLVKHDNLSTAENVLNALYIKIRQASIKLQKAKYLCELYDAQNKGLEEQIHEKEEIIANQKATKTDVDSRLAAAHLCAIEKLNETLQTLEKLKTEKESNELLLNDTKEKLQIEDSREKDFMLLLESLEQLTKHKQA